MTLRCLPSLVVAAIGTATLAQAHPVTALTDRPVMIGQDGPEFDACGTIGKVSGLNPKGDNLLSVRAGPETTYREVDRLEQGQIVWLCDVTRNGRWHGIVYSKGPGDPACEVSSPVASKRLYSGPCQHGWVSARYVEAIAG